MSLRTSIIFAIIFGVLMGLSIILYTDNRNLAIQLNIQHKQITSMNTSVMDLYTEYFNLLKEHNRLVASHNTTIDNVEFHEKEINELVAKIKIHKQWSK